MHSIVSARSRTYVGVGHQGFDGEVVLNFGALEVKLVGCSCKASRASWGFGALVRLSDAGWYFGHRSIGRCGFL